jgi:hypothetical protein
MMPKKRIKRRRKETQHSSHASLAGLAPVIKSKQIFEPIHEHVKIEQKQVLYCPTDKLVFVVLGILAEAEYICDINTKLRPDKPLLTAFGYEGCADQSVIQDTLDVCQVENALQLEVALGQIFAEHNRSQALLFDALMESRQVTIDLDLSGLPASKNAEGSSKGYFSKRRGTYSSFKKCRRFIQGLLQQAPRYLWSAISTYHCPRNPGDCG